MSLKGAPDVDPVQDLTLVAQRGAPAQREQAQRLMAMLAANPDDADTREAARHLVDAYLHDPYLERTTESGL